MALSSTACPTDRCFCQMNSRINRYIINCRHQRLATIPVFSVVDTIFYEITFSMNNFITEIPYSAFRNLKVERIDLLKNSLVSILPGAFSGLETYLKELLIEGNGNIPPPYTKISNLVNLRTLRLQKFQQYTIDQSNYFDRFPHLEVLQLYEFVSLTSIDGFAFQNKLQHLQRLEIIGSSLINIPVQSLIHLKSLQKLYIKESKVTTVYSKSFEQLHNLTDLDLSYNKITTLEKDAFQGIDDQLQLLDLTFGELNPESMTALSSKTWSKLEQLTLSYNNKLESMPEQVFKSMPKLQYLNLVHINLRQITKDLFTGLKSLHTLDLSWNKIEAIDAGAFEHMPTLHELKLNRQFGPTPPPSFTMQISSEAFQGSGTSIAILNLLYTPILPEQFWNVIKTLTNLQTLKLSKTGLSTIPDFGFIHNTKLQEIELEYNDIQTLTSDSFTGPTDSLQRVLLNSNNISSISSCVFKNHVKLESVCLAQNPLNCDCKLYWLYKIVSSHTFPIGPCFHQDFICSSPQKFENQALYTVPLNETCSIYAPESCSYKNHTIATSTTAVTNQASTSITTITAEITTTQKDTELTLKIIGKTTNSINIVWNIKHATEITGFILEYHATIDKLIVKEQLHRDKFVYTITDLKPGMFYSICVTAEINQVADYEVKACRTTQTDSSSSGTENQTGGKDSTPDDMNSRNILIGVILGSTVFVILVVTGLYLVVKYKVQKLKTLQLTLTHLQQRSDQGLADGTGKVCTVDNEYTEFEEMKKAKQYHTIGGKHLHCQYGVDSTYMNESYNAEEIMDDGMDNKIQENDTETESVYSKPDLEQRHSAPSRLNAEDLLRSEKMKRTSRPLPATPGTRQTVDLQSSNNSNLITTQVSVYEYNNKENDPVYHEIR